MLFGPGRRPVPFVGTPWDIQRAAMIVRSRTQADHARHGVPDQAALEQTVGQRRQHDEQVIGTAAEVVVQQGIQ